MPKKTDKKRDSQGSARSSRSDSQGSAGSAKPKPNPFGRSQSSGSEGGLGGLSRARAATEVLGKQGQPYAGKQTGPVRGSFAWGDVFISAGNNRYSMNVREAIRDAALQKEGRPDPGKMTWAQNMIVAFDKALGTKRLEQMIFTDATKKKLEAVLKEQERKIPAQQLQKAMLAGKEEAAKMQREMNAFAQRVSTIIAEDDIANHAELTRARAFEAIGTTFGNMVNAFAAGARAGGRFASNVATGAVTTASNVASSVAASALQAKRDLLKKVGDLQRKGSVAESNAKGYLKDLQQRGKDDLSSFKEGLKKAVTDDRSAFNRERYMREQEADKRTSQGQAKPPVVAKRDTIRFNMQTGTVQTAQTNKNQGRPLPATPVKQGPILPQKKAAQNKPNVPKGRPEGYAQPPKGNAGSSGRGSPQRGSPKGTDGNRFSGV